MNIICSYNDNLKSFLVEIVQFVLTKYAKDLDLSNLTEVELFKKEDFPYSLDGRTTKGGTKIILTSRLFELLPCFSIEKLNGNADFNLILETLYHEMGHVNDWLLMQSLYRAVADASDPKDVMAVQFWLEYIAEKRSCLLGLSQKAHIDFCEVFISWKWPAKQFNYEDASMNNYFYLVKVIPYFLARSIDSMERADYLFRMRNLILKDFISDLDKEIKRIETIGLFDSVEPLRPLSQVINIYRPIFLNS